ncbi:hypothetical protein, partial [Enterococcus faecium]|uniref:hypothetical protein n=1 Tax=Enterococcus faecium TaxID=1352 RepID=UPI003F41C7A6
LRITPSPLHSVADAEALVAALDDVWTTLGLDRTGGWREPGERAIAARPAAPAPLAPFALRREAPAPVSLRPRRGWLDLLTTPFRSG